MENQTVYAKTQLNQKLQYRTNTTEHDTANWKEKKIHKKLIKLTHSEDTWKV